MVFYRALLKNDTHRLLVHKTRRNACMKSTNASEEARCQETIGEWLRQPRKALVQFCPTDGGRYTIENTPTFTRSRYSGFVYAYIKRWLGWPSISQLTTESSVFYSYSWLTALQPILVSPDPTKGLSSMTWPVVCRFHHQSRPAFRLLTLNPSVCRGIDR